MCYCFLIFFILLNIKYSYLIHKIVYRSIWFKEETLTDSTRLSELTWKLWQWKWSPQNPQIWELEFITRYNCVSYLDNRFIGGGLNPAKKKKHIFSLNDRVVQPSSDCYFYRVLCEDKTNTKKAEPSVLFGWTKSGNNMYVAGL